MQLLRAPRAATAVGRPARRRPVDRPPPGCAAPPALPPALPPASPLPTCRARQGPVSKRRRRAQVPRPSRPRPPTSPPRARRPAPAHGPVPPTTPRFARPCTWPVLFRRPLPSPHLLPLAPQARPSWPRVPPLPSRHRPWLRQRLCPRVPPLPSRLRPTATPQVPCSWPPRGLGHARLLRLPASRVPGSYYRPMWGLTCASLLLPAPLQATRAWPLQERGPSHGKRRVAKPPGRWTKTPSTARARVSSSRPFTPCCAHPSPAGIKVPPSRAVPGSDENTVRLARAAPVLHRRRR